MSEEVIKQLREGLRRIESEAMELARTEELDYAERASWKAIAAIARSTLANAEKVSP